MVSKIFTFLGTNAFQNIDKDVYTKFTKYLQNIEKYLRNICKNAKKLEEIYKIFTKYLLNANTRGNLQNIYKQFTNYLRNICKTAKNSNTLALFGFS